MPTDLYLIRLYEAVRSHLPSYLTSLNINKVNKGTFLNGTVSYLIYYGSDRSVNSYCLNIVYDPPRNYLVLLYLTELKVDSRNPPAAQSKGTTAHTHDSIDIKQLK